MEILDLAFLLSRAVSVGSASKTQPLLQNSCWLEENHHSSEAKS